MDERLFQFIWARMGMGTGPFQLSDGNIVEILQPGFRQTGSGPDFFNTKLRSGGLVHVGNVELHIDGQDWYRHGHHKDPTYENVILHVVLKNPVETLTVFERRVPVLDAGPYIPQNMVRLFEGMMSRDTGIPCGGLWDSQCVEIMKLMVPELLIQRLNAKTDELQALYVQAHSDWHQVMLIWLCRYLGGPANAIPFEWLSRQLSWSRLMRLRGDLERIEAMLFGLSGFLEGKAEDAYHEALIREFRHLRRSYPVDVQPLQSSIWQFGGVRPGAYPGLRLAVLALLINRFPDLWDLMSSWRNWKTLYEALQQPLGAYWREHAHFGKKFKGFRSGRIPGSLAVHLVVNVAVPLKYAFGKLRGNEKMMHEAAEALSDIPAMPEQVSRFWKKLGWEYKNASEAQAAIHLFKYFCSKKKCLSCEAGRYMLEKNVHPV